MKGNGGLGAEAPMAFSLRRNSDLWSEFFTILNQNTISVAVIKKRIKGCSPQFWGDLFCVLEDKIIRQRTSLIGGALLVLEFSSATLSLH